MGPSSSRYLWATNSRSHSEQNRRSFVQFQSLSIESHGRHQAEFRSLHDSINQVARLHQQRTIPVERICPVSHLDERVEVIEEDPSSSGPRSNSTSSATKGKQIQTRRLGPSHLAKQQMGTSGIVRVTASMTVQSCPHACKCSCHVQSHFQTPRFLRNVLGQLLLSYTSLVRFKPCDYPPCRKRPTKTQLTYYFPRFLLNRAIAASGFSDCLTAPNSSWAVKIPIVLEDAYIVWRAARRGNIELLQRWLSLRDATPFIIDQNGGNLLHVRRSKGLLQSCSLVLCARSMLR